MNSSTLVQPPAAKDDVITERLDVRALAALYADTGHAVRWPLPAELEAALEVTLREGFARHLAERPVEEICVRHAASSIDGMRSTLRLAEQHVLTTPLRGRGIELGAGCGLLASVVADNSEVESVLAVEVCAAQVQLLVPKVSRHILGDRDATKVVPVVGSFNDLRVPDESIDFVVEYHAYHHSDDLNQTLAETARVLRPGGVVLLFDRVQPDSLSDEEVERLLSQVYSREFLIAYHHPPDIELTRRVNGEHEYRQREWQAAFDAAGLSLERQVVFDASVSPTRAVKGLLSVLPRSVRSRLYQTENATPMTTLRWLRQEATRPFSSRILGRRKETVLLLRKGPPHTTAEPAGNGS